jgi:hypothetical protein
MRNPKLNLEILNGSLDGYVVTLETETIWGKEGEGPLIFPWDTELGAPQARFFLEGGNWWIEGSNAPHETYCANRGKRIEGKIQIEEGDLLKASDTWLLVNQIE